MVMQFPLTHQVQYQRKASGVTRVVLADDHPRVRSGIRHLLEKAPDIKVVGEAADGEEALQLVEELAPDVLLLDIEMPLVDGIEVARRMKQQQSEVRILALSAHHNHQYINGLFSAGAAGYLTKDEAPEKIVKAVRRLGRSETS
jgi:DNA-binding NarL/FixJ family response regulator